MNNLNKFLGLLLIVIGGFLGFVVAIALLLYVLRFFSIIIFHIPGFDGFYEFFVMTFPYMLFMAAHYYLFTKIAGSRSKASRIIARIFLYLAITVCITTVALLTIQFFGFQKEWFTNFKENSQYGLIIQLVFIFIISVVIASGDPKEKNWMEKHQ